MGFTLIGLLLLVAAPPATALLLVAAALVGIGLVGVPSGIVARGADGVGRAARLAQSLFQVGGNVGSALGPVARRRSSSCRAGSSSIAWFSLLALLGIVDAVAASAPGTRRTAWRG